MVECHVAQIDLPFSGISHPCIVGFFGFSVKPFSLIMELVEHGDLYSFLHEDKTTLSLPMQLKIALNVAQGMVKRNAFYASLSCVRHIYTVYLHLSFIEILNPQIY
jgi:serine/threonine protein kinase